MDLIATTTFSQSFYCSEITKISTGGSTQRVQRTEPNVSWGSSIFANTSGVACTEWHSFQGNGSTQIDSHIATSSISNSEFLFFTNYIVIFLLVVIIIFNIFRLENPWKAS